MRLAGEFADSFELVFHYDWDVTKGALTSAHLIAPEGTFLRPGVADEFDNWGNRGGLLRTYRDLRRVLDRRGRKSVFANDAG